jgi:hypothetical protein
MSQIALILAAATVLASAPIPTPPIFVTPVYALTFRSPTSTTMCALPVDWTGSDHGTVMFLQPPKQCGGVGFPSSSRGFSEDVPRIEVYYQYWLDDPDTGPAPCKTVVGQIKLLAKTRKLCRAIQGNNLRISASARYTADIAAWVELALITTPQRLKSDLITFRRLAASVSPCKESWSSSDGKSISVGTGADCPADGKFF